MYVARDLASGNYRYLMMGYDARWRSARKIAQTFLNVQVSKKYIPYQEMESKQVLNDLLDDPARFKQHIRRFTTSLSAIMIFGYRFPHYTGEEIEKLYQVWPVVRSMRSTVPEDATLGSSFVSYESFTDIRNARLSTSSQSLGEVQQCPLWISIRFCDGYRTGQIL